MKLRIRSVSIRDLYGHRAIDLAPSSLTLLTGQNGTGKSSIVRAIDDIIRGGHNPQSLRAGAKSGQTKIEIEDADRKPPAVIYTFNRRVTAKGYSVEVLNESGEPMAEPQTFIRNLFRGYDIGEIVRLRSKELAERLTEIMPVTFDVKALPPVIDYRIIDHQTLPARINLETLDAARAVIYEKRKEFNVLSKRSQEVERDIRSSLPADGIDRQQIEQQLKTIQRARADSTEAYQSKRMEIVGRVESAIAEMRKIFDAECEKVRSVARTEQEGLHLEMSKEWAKMDAAIGAAQETLDAAKRQESLRERLRKANTEVRDYNLKAEELTRALEDIDAVRTKELASLPISDLVVADGEVAYKGLPWSVVNQGQKIRLAFEIADIIQKPESGEQSPIPFMLAELSELDSKGIASLKAVAAEFGYQVIGARPSDEPQLKIETL